MIHKSCFELFGNKDKDLVSGWKEVANESSEDDDGVNLIYSKDCSFQSKDMISQYYIVNNHSTNKTSFLIFFKTHVKYTFFREEQQHI